MKLSISNIAWDPSEDEAVLKLLRRFDVRAIDVAPGKYFPQPDAAEMREVLQVKNWWAQRGIDIIGMQALLFGTQGLNLFGSAESREAMLRHLEAICRIGGLLGATRLVFGSPKNRDRSGLSDQQALEIAAPFFIRLAGIAESHGVYICLEPNPPCYGSNFMTNSAQTAEIVKAVGHSAVKMQFDTGASHINGEDAQLVLERFGEMIGHVHASEAGLVTLGDTDIDHPGMAAAIRRFLPESMITIEMLGTKGEPHLASIERALTVATSFYTSTATVVER